MARKPNTSAPQFSDRERFNWGFWDGINDRDDGHVAEWLAAGCEHCDVVYKAGYMAGGYWRGQRPETSTQAWEKHAA